MELLEECCLKAEHLDVWPLVTPRLARTGAAVAAPIGADHFLAKDVRRSMSAVARLEIQKVAGPHFCRVVCRHVAFTTFRSMPHPAIETAKSGTAAMPSLGLWDKSDPYRFTSSAQLMRERTGPEPTLAKSEIWWIHPFSCTLGPRLH